jgi:hypothetical protein
VKTLPDKRLEFYYRSAHISEPECILCKNYIFSGDASV